MVWSVLLAGALLGAPDPSPGEAGTLGVLPIRVEGDLPGSLRASAQGRQVAGARRGSFAVVEIAGAQTCATPECFADLAARHSVDFLLVGSLTVADGQREYAYEFSVLDAEGQGLFSGKAGCEVCGFAEAAERIEDRVASAAKLLDREAAQQAEVVVAGSPEGATVWLDGELAGTMPLSREVRPGPHKLRIENEGFLPQEIDVEFPSGARKALEIRLRPDPAIEQERIANRRARAMVIVGASLIGIGAAAAGGGGALIGIHERPYRRDCQSDVEGNCRFLYGTQGAGIAMLVSGGVGIITGIVLVAIGKRRQKQRPRAQSFFAPRRASTRATRSRAFALPSLAAER